LQLPKDFFDPQGRESRKERESFVVAGQQPLLLGGPIFTVLKAATAVRLASDLAEKHRIKIKPLFWIASEDHDVFEVCRIKVGGKRYVCSYDGPLKRGQMPCVGSISLINKREEIVQFLTEALPEARWKGWVLEKISSLDFRSYATQFACILRLLFGDRGLRTVLPEEIRRGQAEVFARIFQRWPELQKAFHRGTRRIEEAGFHAPLQRMGIYEVKNGIRVPILIDQKQVKLTDRVCSLSEASRIALSEPERFSPGAALRPIVQDAALPVAVTVAGPTEALYLWQIRELYEVLEVPPSLIALRISATFVSGKDLKKLRQVGIPPEKAFTVSERLEEWERGSSVEENPHIVEIRKRAEALLSAIKATGITQSRLQRRIRNLEATIEKIIDRIYQEEKERQNVAVNRLKALQRKLLPEGKLQERVVSVVEFLASYGPQWAFSLCEALDPWSLCHQLVLVSFEEAQP